MQLFAKFKKILRREFTATFELLAGNIVAMVTYCATQLTATHSLMIGQFVDTMTLASTDKERL